MHLLRYFHQLSIRPENARELRGLILQLAVQGKLTVEWRRQNPDVEPASDMLKRIQQEKFRLVKEKKIKREKPLPKITIAEIPYKLPKSWAWCRLIEVCEYIQRGKSPKYAETSNVPVISQKCVQWTGFDLSRARFIQESSLKKYTPERFLQAGDLLWNSTGDGTVGRVILFPKVEYDQVVADSHVTVVRSMKDYVIPEYLWIFTASPLIQNLVTGRVTGSTKQTELGTGTVKSMEFSLPPLPEQHAIVQIVNTLLQEIDQLEQLTAQRLQLKEDYAASALHQLVTAPASDAWAALKPHFHTFFNEAPNIQKLREAILQLAVQGKLTAAWRRDNPEVEPAGVLLERIREEKARLIKEKKIKKEKALPKIKAGEVPFEVPEGWVWCRMQDIILDIEAGKSPKCLPSPANTDQWGVIKMSAITWGEFNEKENKALPLETEPFPDKEIKPGDFILTRANTGELVAKSVIVHDGIRKKLLLNDKTLRVQFSKSLRIKYINFFNNSVIAREHYLEVASGTSDSMKNISRENIKALYVPLPPYDEQKVIIAKLKDIINLCDQLERYVSLCKSQSEQLLQSALKEVFDHSKPL